VRADLKEVTDWTLNQENGKTLDLWSWDIKE